MDATEWSFPGKSKEEYECWSFSSKSKERGSQGVNLNVNEKRNPSIYKLHANSLSITPNPISLFSKNEQCFLVDCNEFIFPVENSGSEKRKN